MKISEYVKTLRTRAGLSQARFAKKVESNRSAIANYENNRLIPKGDVLLRMQAFELSLAAPTQKIKLHTTFVHKVLTLFSWGKSPKT